MISEGAKVTYAGDADPFNQVGSLGRVVAMSGDAAHVQWSDGPKVGQIDLVELNELVEAARSPQAGAVTASFDDALDMPTTATIAVRATYDTLGEDGVLNALAESGHLAMLTDYVDETVGYLASRLSHDPVLRDVLGSLEADESDGLLSRVASVLLTDRLTEDA